MPRKDQGWITFQTSEEERQLLEEICRVSQRTKTEVLREMLRGLKDAVPAEVVETAELLEVQPTHTPKQRSLPIKPPQEPMSPIDQAPIPKKSLKVSSRNILDGKVKRLVKGAIHTEVTLEIVHRVELTSTITTASAEALELTEGKEAYAVIKSSDVVIATE